MAEASARVLDAAERLFLAQGYAGVRLKHIADALGVRTPSLYHHAPGGKADLWRRVVDRALARHRDGLCRARDAAGPEIGARLDAMAAWLASQPPVNVVAVAASSMGSTSGAEAQRVADGLYEALMVPVAEAVREAQAAGALRSDLAPDLFVRVFVAAVTGLPPAERAGALPETAEALARATVRLLLDGARAGTHAD